MPSFLSLLLSLLSLFLPFISSHPTPISLSLHQFPKNKSPDPLQKLTQLASASLIRAQHLKKHPNSKKTFHSKTPLFPHSYGAYSISLNFGTPPQKSSVIMDTGSNLVWIPCTHSYLCRNCSFLNPKPTALQNPPFIPKFSSSSKLVGCANPKCSWISDPDSRQSNCPGCNPNSPLNCTQICPPYFVFYGSGSTGGILLSDTLVFPEKRIPDFGVGCSLFSTRMPAGIAGFGRGPSSLPSQLGLSRFTYCLLSHRLDDTANSSSLVLDGGSGSGGEGVGYTPFVKNPTAGNPSFSVYYYIGLRKVTVGGKSVNIPYRYLRPGSKGDGGTIIDSGTTFTFMERHVFEPVAREFVTQVGSRYKTVPAVESSVGLRPCFNVSGDMTVMLPQLGFHFKGGAKMELPLANYFSLVGDSEVACLTIVTDGGGLLSGGPSIVLGNFQQQDFLIEFDLKKERLGFRRQQC